MIGGVVRSGVTWTQLAANGSLVSSSTRRTDRNRNPACSVSAPPSPSATTDKVALFSRGIRFRLAPRDRAVRVCGGCVWGRFRRVGSVCGVATRVARPRFGTVTVRRWRSRRYRPRWRYAPILFMNVAAAVSGSCSVPFVRPVRLLGLPPIQIACLQWPAVTTPGQLSLNLRTANPTVHCVPQG